MAEEFDREELEAWLKTQPREVSIAIAARALLRLFPILPTNNLTGASVGKDARDYAISPMPLFKAMAIAHLAKNVSVLGRNDLRSAINGAGDLVSDDRLRRSMASGHPMKALRMSSLNIVESSRFFLRGIDIASEDFDFLLT